MDKNNIPVNSPYNVIQALNVLFDKLETQGLKVTLQPVANKLDVFDIRLVGKCTENDLCMPLGKALGNAKTVDNEEFVWGWSGSYVAPDSSENPRLGTAVLSLLGKAKTCSCHPGKRQIMYFNQKRTSFSRELNKNELEIPYAIMTGKANYISSICSNRKCRRAHAVNPPTDPHTLEHWTYVLADQLDLTKMHQGGVALTVDLRPEIEEI